MGPPSPPGPGTTPTGWRVQAAVWRPGQPRFDPPQNVSPPVSRLSRWLWLDVAAGVGGHSAMTWFYGGAEGLAVRAAPAP